MKRLFGITTVLTTLICLACAPKHSPTVAEGKIYSNGTQLYYKTIGAGQPVVIVHGGPLLDHSYFLPSFEQLAQDFQLIFYDQRLSGRSDPNADTSTIRMRVFVEDIEKLRDSLKLGRVHLLGHSWGGLIAMHYAIKHGTNLRSLTLSNSMSASSAIWQEEEAVLAAKMDQTDSLERAAIRASESFRNYAPTAIEKLLRISFRKQFHDPAKLVQMQIYVPNDYRERSARFGHMMVDLMNYDLHPQLSDVGIPTLLIYGDSEPATQLTLPGLLKALPASQSLVMPDCGHFPFIEQPDAYFQALVRFWNQQGQGD